jgi:hypothetical protein
MRWNVPLILIRRRVAEGVPHLVDGEDATTSDGPVGVPAPPDRAC